DASGAPSARGGRRWWSATATPTRTSCSSARPRATTRTARGSRSWARRASSSTGSSAGSGSARSRASAPTCSSAARPGTRNRPPAEIQAGEGHLHRQVSLIRPRVIATLGNFATKLLSGRPDGISRVHGHELPIQVGDLPVLLYPLFHPAAALYTPAMMATLE